MYTFDRFLPLESRVGCLPPYVFGFARGLIFTFGFSGSYVSMLCSCFLFSYFPWRTHISEPFSHYQRARSSDTLWWRFSLSPTSEACRPTCQPACLPSKACCQKSKLNKDAIFDRRCSFWSAAKESLHCRPRRQLKNISVASKIGVEKTSP